VGGNVRILLALTCLVVGLLLAGRAAPAAWVESLADESQGHTQFEDTILERCPAAAEAVKLQHQAADRRRAPPIHRVTRPLLQRELILRSEQDQAARGVTKFSETGRGLDMEYMKEVDADNYAGSNTSSIKTASDRPHGRVRRPPSRVAAGAAR